MFEKLFAKKTEVRESVFTNDIIEWLTSNEVDPSVALSVPTIAAIVNLIAGTISTLPVEIVGKDGTPRDDYREALLNAECGDLLSSQEMKYMIIRDWILTGAGYYYCDWQGTKLSRLVYCKPKSVGTSFNGMNLNREGFFTVDDKIIQPPYMGRILRNTQNGMKGSGICQDCADYINLLVNLQNLQSRTSKTGGKLLLQPSMKLTSDALTNLKNAWQRLYGSATGEAVMVMNSEIMANQLQSMVSGETSTVETSSSDKLATALGVPSKILYGGASTQDYALLRNNCLVPLCRLLEASFDRFLLLEKEKGTIRFKINTDNLTLETLGERMAAYQTALSNSTMSINEVREREGMPALDKDYMHISLASVLWNPENGEIYTPNTNQTTNINNKRKEEGGEMNDGDTKEQ